MCGSRRCRVVEEEIDEVTVIECDDCGASWAVRHDE